MFENNLVSELSQQTHTLTSAGPTYGSSIFGDYSGQITGGVSTFSISDHPDFDTNLSSGFTISFWIKFESSGIHRFLSKACYTGTIWNDSSFMFTRQSSDRLEFSMFDNGTVKTNITGGGS